MAEDYWHAGRRFLVSLLFLFSVRASVAQRTVSSSSSASSKQLNYDLYCCVFTVAIIFFSITCFLALQNVTKRF